MYFTYVYFYFKWIQSVHLSIESIIHFIIYSLIYVYLNIIPDLIFARERLKNAVFFAEEF